MLVKLTDHKGRDHFVNPLYVRSVIEKKPGVIEVHGSIGTMSSKIVLKGQSLSNVCDRISIGLTSIGAPATAIIDDQQQTNAAAASGGGAAAASAT